MAPQTHQPSQREVFALAKKQHGMVTLEQLTDMGLGWEATRHRIRRGRLHVVFPGVYKVGTPDVTQFGLWMAAVLKCRPDAFLSHEDASALWRLGRRARRGAIHITVRRPSALRIRGIKLHRRPSIGQAEVTRHHGIPVTTPATTIVDLATGASPAELDSMISDADARGLCTPERVRDAAAAAVRRPGARRVRTLVERRTFRFRTRSGLERAFLLLAERAGLPPPLTRQWLNGYEVDFYWPELGLVVETDGGRFHRSPAQQTRDRLRDQAHTAAGLVPLRFTEDQIAHTPAYVCETLGTVGRRLLANPAPGAFTPSQPSRLDLVTPAS